MISRMTPSKLFNWQVKYLDIYLFYVYSHNLMAGQKCVSGIGTFGVILRLSAIETVDLILRFSIDILILIPRGSSDVDSGYKYCTNVFVLTSSSSSSFCTKSYTQVNILINIISQVLDVPLNFSRAIPLSREHLRRRKLPRPKPA